MSAYTRQISVKLHWSVQNGCRFVCVKFYFIWCRFALVTAKCLGGGTFLWTPRICSFDHALRCWYCKLGVGNYIWFVNNKISVQQYVMFHWSHCWNTACVSTRRWCASISWGHHIILL